jgi:hypothetical protein
MQQLRQAHARPPLSLSLSLSIMVHVDVLILIMLGSGSSNTWCVKRRRHEDTFETTAAE